MISRRALSRGLGAISIGLIGRPVTARPAFAWPQSRRAAVSLTYDDGLNSQLDNAVPQLDAHGFKATFFLTLENMQARKADWMAVAEHGHEIGDHSVSHPCDLRGFTPSSFAKRQIDPMEALLDANFGGETPRLYAYPCGATELARAGGLNARQSAYVRLLRRRFAGARIVDGGPNDPRLVNRFRYLLQANAPTYDADDAQLAFNYVLSAIDRGYWAILIFHEVVSIRREVGETSMAAHDAILDWIARQPVWCAPMRQVFDYVQNRSA